MRAIPDLEDGMLDGSAYTVEIERGDSCASYRYHEPEDFQDDFWQAKNMVEILKKIDLEFGIPWDMGDEASRQRFDLVVNDPSLKLVSRFNRRE